MYENRREASYPSEQHLEKRLLAIIEIQNVAGPSI